MIVTGVERGREYHDAVQCVILYNTPEDARGILADEFDVVYGPENPMYTQHGCDSRARELGISRPRPCIACGAWRPSMSAVLKLWQCDACRHAWFCANGKCVNHPAVLEHRLRCSRRRVETHGGYGEFVDYRGVARILLGEDKRRALMRLWDEHGIVHVQVTDGVTRAFTALGCDRWFTEEGRWRVPPSPGQQFRPCRSCDEWARWAPGDAVRTSVELCRLCARAWVCDGHHDPEECTYFRVAAAVHAKRLLAFPGIAPVVIGGKTIVAGRNVTTRTDIERGLSPSILPTWFPHEPEGIREALDDLCSFPTLGKARDFLERFDVVAAAVDCGVQVVYTRTGADASRRIAASRMCWECGRWEAGMRVCGGCRRASYCDRTCQRDDRSDHREFCSLYA